MNCIGNNMLINNQGEDMVKNNPLSADVLTSIFRTSPKDEHVVFCFAISK